MTPTEIHPPRLARLLGADGRTSLGLFDNGVFGEPSWSALIPLIDELITNPENRAFDGISVPRGSAERLQALPARDKPALILRADVNDYWLGNFDGPFSSSPLAGAVEDAVRLDAACVVTILLRSSSDPSLQTACLRTADRIRSDCDRYAMPVMIEAVAFDDRDGQLVPDYSVETMATLAWQAAELGADIVKTDPVSDPAEFSAVVAAGGGRPVLAGSGPAGSDEEIAARAAALVAAGAAGVGFGGNYTRTANPFHLAREVAAAVHG